MCKDNLLKRARAKYLSINFAIKLRNGNPESPLRQSYLNTYHCLNNMIVDEDGYLKGKYCKNRWCAVCNRIRTGHLINSYEPELKKFKEPYFITLTRKTCLKSELENRMKEMQNCHRSMLRKYVRKEKKSIVGLRKSECTVRPGGRYHFHYHYLVDGQGAGDYLLNEWLDKNADSGIDGQDLRRANEGSIKELFKYFTKVTHKGELSNIKSLDWIFQKMRGKRVFQPFGGLKKVTEDIDQDLIKWEKLPLGKEGLEWRWREIDWISEHAECLTGYTPSEKLQEFFNRPTLQK